MFLTTTNLVHYLIARGMVSPEAVVDGPLRIIDFARRNRNFKVILGDASGLFLKQLPHLVEGTGGGPSRELACHRLASSRPEYAPLLDLMPRFRGHDPDLRVLATELVQPGEDLRERQERLGPMSGSLAQVLGQALGRLHALDSLVAARPNDFQTYPRARPWILDTLNDAEGLSRDLNPAQREILTAILQSPELTYGLDGLRKAWRPTTLVHGDLKRDNIVVRPTDDGEKAEPRFIDWELADVGDPAWDVAGLLLTCLEPSLVQTPSEDPAQFLPTIDSARIALQAFWREYVRTLGLSAARDAAYRVRCVHFLGAKLLLYAVELLDTRPEASPTTRLATRLARSIMVDPARIADDLLGS